MSLSQYELAELSRIVAAQAGTNEALIARCEALGVRVAELEADTVRKSPAPWPAPINEAGITATFAAIFAALDSLLDRVATLESARIAAPTAPESTETGPGVPMEPGTQCGTCKGTGRFLDWGDMGAPKRAEVAAALRMYRKVQRLQACDDIFGFGVKMDTFLHFQYAAPLLAWLKEGEA